MGVRILLAMGLSLLLIWTLILNIYHLGVYPAPAVDRAQSANAIWQARSKPGLNHLILRGPPFARGRESGRLTSHLLLEQETQLILRLGRILNSQWLMQGLVLSAIAWFQGVERYLESPFLEEMYGVSLSASKKFDYIADGFTRQVAYHGLHEVGQMMVDQGTEDLGCTQVAIRYKNQFVIGRNFDFEGGRIFDSEKIVKWVFPEQGNAFVSIIWAGMVGAVTGVNDHGLYIALNAAGSDDLRRLGTPSTLILLKILQQAKTALVAIEILRREQVFITDIFVLLDSSGQLYRIEKSPERMDVMRLMGNSVVTNHLISPIFKNDKTNQYRIHELTTLARATRGENLVAALPTPTDSKRAVQQVLRVLRDKGVDKNGKSLPVGNRRAIDGLIATHSVIYNPSENEMFVSVGPGLSGEFLGYDLKASFSTGRPVLKSKLPTDTLVPEELYHAIQQVRQVISDSERMVDKNKCEEALLKLQNSVPSAAGQSGFYAVRGDAHACLHDFTKAREDWKQALQLNPPYQRQRQELEKKLGQGDL